MTIRRLLLSLVTLFLGWVTVMALVMRFSDAAPAAVVLFPGTSFLQRLSESTALIGRSAISVTLSSETPGFARQLYRQGAILVLPAGLIGCLPLTRILN